MKLEEFTSEGLPVPSISLPFLTMWLDPSGSAPLLAGTYGYCHIMLLTLHLYKVHTAFITALDTTNIYLIGLNIGAILTIHSII